MAKRSFRGRRINGILLLDKPAGITSNSALQTVKSCVAARKAGHTGSLDPLATGLLPICFGEGTKFSQYLLESDKTYEVTALLGVKTNTGDAEGEVVEQRKATHITQADVEVVLPRFRGEIEQIPSMFSALKHQGQPLYQLARQGIEVERKARRITIFDLTLVKHQDQQLSLLVRCSKGTYVRTLLEDIGEALGCGAHVIALRRTQVNQFSEGDSVRLDHLVQLYEAKDFETLNAYIRPVADIVGTWQSVNLTDATAAYLLKGQPVIIPNAPTEGWVRLCLKNGTFLGVGEILDDGRVAPRRLLTA